jgi:hypothetical protein
LAIINTSQPQKQAGTLFFDVDYRPQRPRPLHVANGKDVFHGIVVRHHTNRITGGQIGVQITSSDKSPSVLYDIAVKITFGYDVFPNAVALIRTVGVANLPKEPCHPLPTDQTLRVNVQLAAVFGAK